MSLLLAACGNNEEPDSDTPPVTEEPTEEVDSEESIEDEIEEQEDAAYKP